MSCFLDNKYTRWYWAIIQQRRVRPLGDSLYSEQHHAVPRSLGGGEGNNLVQLSAREHFICHWLLTRMTVGEDRAKMLKAFWAMRANKTKNRYVNARAYEVLKTEYSKIQSERVRGDKNPQWGKTWSDERKQNHSQRVSGDLNGSKKPEARQKIREKKLGTTRQQFSDEWLANLSKNHKSKQSGFDGSHSESTKKLLSELASKRRYSKETNEKRRKESSGRKEITNGVIYKKVKLVELQQWLDAGWIVQGKSRKKKIKTT